jgi:hypothetical protein
MPIDSWRALILVLCRVRYHCLVYGWYCLRSYWNGMFFNTSTMYPVHMPVQYLVYALDGWFGKFEYMIELSLLSSIIYSLSKVNFDSFSCILSWYLTIVKWCIWQDLILPSKSWTSTNSSILYTLIIFDIKIILIRENSMLDHSNIFHWCLVQKTNSIWMNNKFEFAPPDFSILGLFNTLQLKCIPCC